MRGEDGVKIECSCGFEGSPEPTEIDTSIGKYGLVRCPECRTIHIVEYNRDRGARTARKTGGERMNRKKKIGKVIAMGGAWSLGVAFDVLSVLLFLSVALDSGTLAEQITPTGFYILGCATPMLVWGGYQLISMGNWLARGLGE